MKHLFTSALAAFMLFSFGSLNAQRYLTEVFTDAEITITNDVVYGENISIENTVIQALNGINPPAAPSATNLLMDIYQPSQAVDTETERPLVVYLHTGNFLPPIANRAPTGTRKDSSAVNIAKLMAKRGYVCVVAEYRKGWNPVSPSQLVRTGTILNAAYKGQQDSKAAVRFMRANAANYKIASDKVVLIGEGTGGYVAMAHAFLDQPFKISRLPGIGDNKFLRTESPSPDSSVVDTNRVGNFDGTNDIPLNLAAFAVTGDFTKVTGNIANTPGQPSNAQLVINLGGALGDTSWLDAGQIPMIGIHAVRDPNAPYQIGDVIVPTTGDIVIPFASGAGFNVAQANAYGNNASFSNKLYDDAITAAIESRYNQSIPFAGTTIPTGSGKGLLPFILPEAPLYPFNHGSPWQFWSSTSPQAQFVTTTLDPNPDSAGTFANIHELNILSNPFMGAGDVVGRNTALTYIDTIMQFINPRIVCALGLPECDNFQDIGINEVISQDLFVVYPNPARDFVNIHVKAGVASLKSVRLFDMMGREVFAQSGINQPKLQVNRELLKSGVYFAIIETTSGTSQVKLIFN